MRNGRPLRFLMMTVSGWTLLRVAMLWPQPVPPSPQHVPVPKRAASGWMPWMASAEAALAPTLLPSAIPAAAGMPTTRPAPPVSRVAAAPLRAISPAVAHARLPLALALAALLRFGRDDTAAEPQAEGVIPPPLRPTPLAASSSRLAGSAWLIARGGNNGTLLGGQLGGSQAGARITYAIGSARRLALAARVATPLSGSGREAAIGVEWRPLRAPVRVIAEQRVSLDGGKGGPTLMAVGGIGPTPIAAGFRLEGYAQAGAIARAGVEGFADGAARLTRPVATVGDVAIDLGIGGWGAAQRGAARLDVGPSLGAAVPIGRRAVRLTLDYRARVAGDARPGSGVALSIGSDF